MGTADGVALREQPCVIANEWSLLGSWRMPSARLTHPWSPSVEEQIDRKPFAVDRGSSRSLAIRRPRARWGQLQSSPSSDRDRQTLCGKVGPILLELVSGTTIRPVDHAKATFRVADL